MTAALAGALLAGVLTTLAPCSLSLLPVIVGGSLQGAAQSRAAMRVVVITGSLAVSVFAFTLLLKASTALIGIPPKVWQYFSGSLLIVLGIFAVFPQIWEHIATRTGFADRSALGLNAAARRGRWAGPVLTGVALGPVFTSCSPLFGYVIVTVLPAEPGRGLALLSAYVLGLAAVLLLIGLLGQRVVSKLRWAADPRSVLRRVIGVLFIVVGLLIATGLMQGLEAWLVEHSPVRPWEIGS